MSWLLLLCWGTCLARGLPSPPLPSSLQGGAIDQTNSGFLYVYNSNFTSNAALRFGGGVSGSAEGELWLTGCNFTGNSALGWGGAVELVSTSILRVIEWVTLG